jgi:hypothetical protein
MPQLDIASFFNQIFSVLFFISLYFLIVSKGIIPAVYYIKNTRAVYLQILQSLVKSTSEDLLVSEDFSKTHNESQVINQAVR